MKMVKKGDRGPHVKTLQGKLGIKIDGIFGPITEKAVINFQLNYSLIPNGIVDNDMWTLLLLGKKALEELDEDSDISEQYDYQSDLVIHKYYLKPKSYVDTNVKLEYLFLHHTAGWDNPYNVIDYWERDSRGRVATEFVVGGNNIKTGKGKYNGVILQAFPEGKYGYHLGRTGSGFMNRHSAGIELCSFGYLENGKTYTGTQVIDSEIIVLDQKFRGYKEWHKYSEEQVDATINLIKYIADRDSIDVREGLIKRIKEDGPFKAFDFYQNAYEGKVKGLLSHSNVRRDKFDCYPDPYLIEQLLKI